jgi:hypothetical protein
MMEAEQRLSIRNMALGLILASFPVLPLQGQESPATTKSATGQTQSDPVADLSPENRQLFDSLRKASQENDDAATLASGKKLLPALQPGTPLSDFVTRLTTGAAVETGDTAYALNRLKPFTDAHPDDWRAASLLARVYAESGDKQLRDQQIAHVIALHKETTDQNFAKLHVFPIQKVKLHSGSAVFLYPFAPLKPYNTYLLALIYTSEGKTDYRLEVGSEDADQAFFKPKKPGERRFSIDSYRKNEKDGNLPESQALHGFMDGLFDYDRMRDALVKTANGESVQHN